MKKKIIIALVALLVIIAGLFTYITLNAGKIISAYKPDLEKQATEALGAAVTIGNMDLSLFPSARITVNNFKIASASSGEQGLTLKKLTLHTGFLPLLTGKVKVYKLSIDSPALHVIKDENGIYLEGLRPAAGKKASEAGGQANKKPLKADTKRGKTSTATSSINFSLDNLAVKNAAFFFVDKTASRELILKNLSLESAIALTNNTLTITKGRLNVPGGEFEFGLKYNLESKNGSVSLSGSGYSLDGLEPFYALAPALKDLRLSGHIAPDIKVNLAGAKLPLIDGKISLSGISLKPADLNVSELGGDIILRGENNRQKISSEDLSFKLESELLSLKFEAINTTTEFKLETARISGFNGNVNASVDYQYASGSFKTALNAAAIDIEKALVALRQGQDSRFSGKLDSFNARISGAAGQDLVKSIKGNADLVLLDGRLKGFNLARETLGSIKLPFLSGALLGSAPEENREQIESPDTPIKKLSGRFKIANETVRVLNLSLVSYLFSAQSSGLVKFNSQADLDITLKFVPAFSAAIVSRVKELKASLDQEGQLVIPLRLSGTAPAFKVLPDLQALTRSALKNRAGKVLEGLLGGGKKTGKQGGQRKKSKGLGGLLGF